MTRHTPAYTSFVDCTYWQTDKSVWSLDFLGVEASDFVGVLVCSLCFSLSFSFEAFSFFSLAFSDFSLAFSVFSFVLLFSSLVLGLFSFSVDLSLDALARLSGEEAGLCVVVAVVELSPSVLSLVSLVWEADGAGVSFDLFSSPLTLVKVNVNN